MICSVCLGGGDGEMSCLSGGGTVICPVCLGGGGMMRCPVCLVGGR